MFDKLAGLTETQKRLRQDTIRFLDATELPDGSIAYQDEVAVSADATEPRFFVLSHVHTEAFSNMTIAFGPEGGVLYSTEAVQYLSDNKVEMPTWWKPEHRDVWQVRGPGWSRDDYERTFGSLADLQNYMTKRHGTMEYDDVDSYARHVTADLATGNEVLVTPAPARSQSLTM
ncbi:MAG: hypothetical protein ACYDGM_14365 [Vulcanimicrobiaceae bacterium]